MFIRGFFWVGGIWLSSKKGKNRLEGLGDQAWHSHGTTLVKCGLDMWNECLASGLWGQWPGPSSLQWHPRRSEEEGYPLEWGQQLPRHLKRPKNPIALWQKRSPKFNCFRALEEPFELLSRLWLCTAIPGPSGCQHACWSWAMLEAQKCPTIHWETLPRTQEARASSSFYANKAKQ